MSAPPLSLSLAFSRELLSQAGPGYGRGFALAAGGEDPFFIDLPAFQGGLGGRVTAEALRVLASLYFTAEVEGTYLMAVAEELAQARFTLNLTDAEAARKLEDLATRMRGGWVPRALRNQIFGRVFGIGYADPALGDGMVNQQFEPQFARFASAARELGMSHSPYGPSSPLGAAARLTVAAGGLMGALAPKLQGNTLLVAERLTRQLQLAIDALNHPGLTSLFMGRTAWDVVRGVLGQDTPDLQAQVNRAQTGMRIMAWMAAHLGPLQSQDSEAVLAAAQVEPQLAQWAEIWLQSSGMPQQGGQPQQGAGYGAPPQSGSGAPQHPGYGAPQQPGYGATQQPGYGAAGYGGYGQPAPQTGGYGAQGGYGGYPTQGAYGHQPAAGWPG
ncbi:MAG: hypothetical protein RIG84_07240 [Roseovarius sp.]